MNKDEKGLIHSGTDLFGKKSFCGYTMGGGVVLKMIGRDKGNDYIRRNHYSGKVYAGSTEHFGVFKNGEMQGVLQFGYAMNPASGGSIVDGAKKENFYELNRMHISDLMPKNTESACISAAIKILKNNNRSLKFIQSFADERCGKNGIVYQAANFGYYGEHLAIFWEFNGVMYHNIIMTAKHGKGGTMERVLQENKDLAIKHELRQFRYLFFVDKSWEKRCLIKNHTYTKHYNE